VQGQSVVKWDYDRGEILADGIVHALGIILGLAAVTVLFVIAARTLGFWELASVLIYGGGLLTVLTVSALYNLWPVSDAKWILRRFDHSAIYLLIAGTYTPIVAQLKASVESIALLVGVWVMSAVGVAVKLWLPGRFDRLSILLYLLAGWSGVIIYRSLPDALPGFSLWLLVAGGVLYTSGVIFHLWHSLRFQNAIWHAFVLAAAACHYGAVLTCVMAARA
jgi:hemolysin III